MKHETKRFGTLGYREDEVYTFSQGLLGFPECRRFLIRRYEKTAPIRWLISLDEKAEFPIISPKKIPIGSCTNKAANEAAAAVLGNDRLKVYCMLVLPKKLTDCTINKRAILYINPKTREGLHYAGMPLNHQPVACRVYRELFTICT